jgi:hypothetical protein
VLDAAKAQSFARRLKARRPFRLLGRQRDAEHGGADEDTLAAGTRRWTRKHPCRRLAHSAQTCPEHAPTLRVRGVREHGIEEYMYGFLNVLYYFDQLFAILEIFREICPRSPGFLRLFWPCATRDEQLVEIVQY